MEMKILYAGDSPVGGPANYLLGVLRSLKASVVHVPPVKKLRPVLFRQKYDAFLLSDFSRKNVPQASEKAIVEQVKRGAGLMMVGGWGSFSGPFGHWRGSLVEKILPVQCLSRDDRLNFPGGAFIVEKEKHPMFRGIRFNHPPVICGLNQVRPKKSNLVILTARRVFWSPLPQWGRGLGEGKEYPLLVIDRDPQKRIAALTTDLAPHWCGGLVDWGRRRMSLRVKDKIQIETGDLYVRFVSSLLKWLARKG